jgi:hypothetical protein
MINLAQFRVPTFIPGIAVIVVAGLFPEAGAVYSGELDRPHPLGTFPEVALWDQRAQGKSVLRFKEFTLLPVRQKDTVFKHSLQG